MRKIAVFGPPCAGKRTLLEELAADDKGKMSYFAVALDQTDRTKFPLKPDGEVLYMTREEVNKSAAHNVGIYLTVERDDKKTVMLTFCGTLWTVSLWDYYISRADAVVLVLDSQETRMDLNCIYMEALSEMKQAPGVGCVFWTKQDLSHNISLPGAVGRSLQNSRFAKWPVFPSSKFERASLLKPMNWLINYAHRDELLPIP